MDTIAYRGAGLREGLSIRCTVPLARARQRRIIVAFFVSLVGMALASGPALGATAHVFHSSFGSVAPNDVAVDQSTGDVYVVHGENDLVVENELVERFNSNGEPANFSALGTNVLDGASGPDLTPQGSFSFDVFGANQVAVDNSGGATNGDVYVTDSLNNVVDVFNSAGVYLGQLDGSGAPQLGELCGVAVGPSGSVYVGDYGGNAVEKYVPSANPVKNSDFVSQISGVPSPCQVAVDSAGNVYALSYFGVVRKYNSRGESLGIVDHNTTFSIAVDPATQDVYADEGARVAQYDSSGALLDTFPTLATGGNSYGVAEDGASGYVYVSDEENHLVDIYEVPPRLLPVVDGTFVKGVSSTSAEVRASINPRYYDTHYYFQYGLGTSYEDTPVSPAEVDLGSESVDQSAYTTLEHLLPRTTYHYRVVARNAAGIEYGPDRTFTTYPSTLPTLPDGRAWEMVSPLEKGGGEIAPITTARGGNEGVLSGGGVAQAAEDGNAVTYLSSTAFAEPAAAPRGSQYLSVRTSTGWPTRDITAPESAKSYGPTGFGPPYYAFSTDLSNWLMRSGDPIALSITNSVPAPGGPPGYQNLYVAFDGAFQPVITVAHAPSHRAIDLSNEFILEYGAATPDLRHVVFAANDELTAGSVDPGWGRRDLYEWSEGQLWPVNILPGGIPQTSAELGSALGYGGSDVTHAISDDGSRIFWTDNSSNENLYVREHADRPESPLNSAGECIDPNDACTIQVDASRGGAGSGKGVFLTASADGSRVFFMDRQQLTADSTAGNYDLYEFDVEDHSLIDLTVDSADAEGAAVEGVLGASADGSYVYFVAKGNLASGAESGQYNLYFSHEGKVTFIARLSGDDEPDWVKGDVYRTAAVTANGHRVTFMSDARLTEYDNTDANVGRPDKEVYIFDATRAVGKGNPLCVSCNPSGARPVGGPDPLSGSFGVAASIPAGTPYKLTSSTYRSRYLTDEGDRLFFDATDPLSPQATNGQQNVYEWEEDGTGSCGATGGCVSLISDGKSVDGSSFIDASTSGNDVFFITRSQLVSQDTDQLVDLYDARVGGGLPSPSAPPAPCSGEGCRPAAASAPAPLSLVTSLSGPSGNLRPAASTKSKPKAKVKKHKAKKGNGRKTNKRRTRSRTSSVGRAQSVLRTSRQGRRG
jgi:hypothetical protein